MIGAQQVVEIALAEAARLGKADETIVIVADRSDAALRWANNSMTTNGVSVQRKTTVISVVRRGERGHVASLTSSEVDPSVIPALVAASQEAALAAPEARDSAPPLAGTDAASDWDAPIPGTGVEVFAGVAEALTRGFRPRPTRCTDTRDTSWRPRSSPPRAGCGGATPSRPDRSRSTPNAMAPARGRASSTPDFVDVPTDSMLDELSTRLGWAQRTVELPAGRYETILPPSAVADLMIYLSWSMDGRGAQEGRTAFSAPGGGTRVGEKLTDLPLTLYSDPAAAGLECLPFVAAASSSERASVFDNGMDIDRVDWIRDGAINALAYPRAAAAEFDVPVAVAADNLLMTGGSASLADMIAGTERGLLLTTLWYIREVDPAVLLLTGLTRDGVYLVEDGQVTGAVNNFRFNESPLDLLRRATQAGASEVTLPREWGDWATRAAMPSLRIPDFHMSSVSQAQ